MSRRASRGAAAPSPPVAGAFPAPVVFASCLLFSAAVRALFPGAAWLAFPACLLPLLPFWLAPLPPGFPGRVFAPDPFAPGFGAFASVLAGDIAAAGSAGASAGWLLCPVLDGLGGPVAYSVDFDSGKGRVVVGARGRREAAGAVGGTVFRPDSRTRLPVVVSSSPVVLLVAPGPRRGEASLSVPFPWRLGPSSPSVLAACLWPAVLLSVHNACGGGGRSLARVVLLALVPFVLRPLLARFFTSRRRPMRVPRHAPHA